MTSHRRHVPTSFLINRCQIITFLILKSDIIENSRIELRNSLASTFKSNKSYIYYYFTLQLGTYVIFSCFTSKLKEKVGGLLVGGQRVCCPPSQIIGGLAPPGPPPPPPPSSYAYDLITLNIYSLFPPTLKSIQHNTKHITQTRNYKTLHSNYKYYNA